MSLIFSSSVHASAGRTLLGCSWYQMRLRMLVNELQVMSCDSLVSLVRQVRARGIASVPRTCHGNERRWLQHGAHLRAARGPAVTRNHDLRMPAIRWTGWHVVGRLPTPQSIHPRCSEPGSRPSVALLERSFLTPAQTRLEPPMALLRLHEDCQGTDDPLFLELARQATGLSTTSPKAWARTAWLGAETPRSGRWRAVFPERMNDHDMYKLRAPNGPNPVANEADAGAKGNRCIS